MRRVPLSPAEIRAAQQAVLEAPLHRALGMRFTDEHDPARGLTVTVSDLVRNNFGVLHGGLVPLFLDVAVYLAVLPTLEPGTNVVTHTNTVSLLRAVPDGTTLRFEGTVDRRGRTLVFCSATGHDDEGRLVSTAQLVKSVVAT